MHYRAERDLPQGGDAPAAGHSGKVQVREVSMQCSFEACVLSMILKLLNSYGCSYFTHACLVFPSGTPECRPSPRSLFTRLSREEEDFLNILSQRPSRFILRSVLHSCPPRKTDGHFIPLNHFATTARWPLTGGTDSQNTAAHCASLC